MLKRFIKYYSDSQDICFRFIESLMDVQLDWKVNSPEIYILTSINLTKNDCNSIALLLKENDLGSAIMICRNLIEMSFNFNWIFEPHELGLDNAKLEESIKERFYKLQGTPYYDIEKNQNEMENDQNNDKPVWDANTIKQTRELIEGIKSKFPFLMRTDKNGERVFKKAPSFKERMGKLKLTHYHVYTFTSIFTHPNPMINEIYFPNKQGSSIESMRAIKQILSLGLFSARAILGYARITFDSLNLNEIRNQCDEELNKIYLRSQEDLK